MVDGFGEEPTVQPRQRVVWESEDPFKYGDKYALSSDLVAK